MHASSYISFEHTIVIYNVIVIVTCCAKRNSSNVPSLVSRLEHHHDCSVCISLS